MTATSAALTDALRRLNRPRMLVGAARKGLAFYRRDRDLAGILRRMPEAARTNPGKALLTCEAHLEEIRRAGDVRYAFSDHIAVLTALLAEAATEPQPQRTPNLATISRKAA